MNSKYDPILLTANGKHYLCESTGSNSVEVYELRPGGVTRLIDEWITHEFTSRAHFVSYCEQIVKTDPQPVY